MKDHKINELMEYLLNALLVEKPKDPTAFLVETLKEIQKKNINSALKQQDYETIFDLIDVTGKASITNDQLIKCLENLQVDRKQVESVRKLLDSGSAQHVDKKRFCSIASESLNVLKDTPYS